jgi:hypothetical protein
MGDVGEELAGTLVVLALLLVGDVATKDCSELVHTGNYNGQV